MDFWLPLVLGAGVLAGLDLLWTRPLPPRSGVSAAALDVTTSGGTAGADRPQVEFGLFSPAFVRQRLDALAAELDRLDRDPEVFARAFHVLAARAAYQALLADATRFVPEPHRSAGPVLELDVEGAVYGRREVLDL